MTINESLSIPSALKTARPNDYYENAVTIDWPSDVFGRPEHIYGGYLQAVVFRDGGHTAAAKEFVRFLVQHGGLARYLTEAGDRLLPPSRKMLDQPFWLDPDAPHRMRSTIQAISRPHVWLQYGLDRDQQARLEHVGRFTGWGEAVHRVVADGLSSEQAADEVIARVHQLLGE